MRRDIVISFCVLALLVSATGCSTFSKKKTSALQAENESLREELDALRQEKDQELERALRDLTRSLKRELADYQAKLEMTERGLVITFLAEVFFDPGKDIVRQSGKASLDKVAKVLNADVRGSNVAVEGYTDSDPIKYSGWKSNWELSAARALAVLHYFVEQGDIDPERLSAVAYGEYRPVASNATKEGKQKNRRVEIVILPSKIKRVAP